ncbi:STAS domain-containing protein [Streptomyces sp. G5(2025)]|uniref:STAS domain-containing protein n=1 Tax=Streptomyces sp. G5(2025) TaxID=3406628 RepID=UPI003C288962
MTTPTDDAHLSVQHTSGPLAVAVVTGAMERHTASAVRSTALDVINQGQPHLILDLTGVTFCDSSGLSALIGIWHGANDADGSLALAAVPARLMRILTLTGVDTLMPIHATPADALAAHRATRRTGGGEKALPRTL